MKIAINNCHGGFSLSTEAYEWLIKNKDWKVTTWRDSNNLIDKSAQLVEANEHDFDWLKYYPIDDDRASLDFRSNLDVIECIETLGEKANGRCAEIKIVDVPDDVDIYIDEYDGAEWVAEKHRTWS